jgi:hypothetical protein
VQLVEVEIIRPQPFETFLCRFYGISSPEMPRGYFRRKKDVSANAPNRLTYDLFAAVRFSGIDEASAQRDARPNRFNPSCVLPGSETHGRQLYAGCCQFSVIQGGRNRAVRLADVVVEVR